MGIATIADINKELKYQMLNFFDDINVFLPISKDYSAKKII